MIGNTFSFIKMPPLYLCQSDQVCRTQGSVLGPLVFLIYINDIHEAVLTSSVYIFANDTKLLKRVVDGSETVSLQDDLDSIDGWCSDWNLKLNCGKCSHLHFSLRGTAASDSFTTGGSAIAGCKSVKDLGITVTPTLSWSNHNNIIIGKICARARRIIPRQSPVSLRKTLYLTTVRSHL